MFYWKGLWRQTEYAEIDKYDLWTVVHNQTQLENLLAYNWQKPATVWLKMDSGMHRVGFFPHNFAAAYTALSQSNKVANIVKMTHFACADEDETGMTEMQIEIL